MTALAIILAIFGIVMLLVVLAFLGVGFAEGIVAFGVIVIAAIVGPPVRLYRHLYRQDPTVVKISTVITVLCLVGVFVRAVLPT